MNEQIGNGVALVTGASSGIGATYAERLARRGHDLLLVARDRQRLEALADRLRQAHGVRVEILRADLSERDDRLRVERRLRDDASIALLVNNAGVAMNGPLADADMDRAERMIALNVVALTRLAAGAAEGSAGVAAAPSSISVRWWRWRRSCSMPSIARPRPTC